jgi:hypothetical protein
MATMELTTEALAQLTITLESITIENSDTQSQSDNSSTTTDRSLATRNGRLANAILCLNVCLN